MLPHSVDQLDVTTKRRGCDVVIPYCRTNLPWRGASVDSILNQVGAAFTVHLVADGFGVPEEALKFQHHPKVRAFGLKGTSLATAQVETIRTKL